MNVRTMLAIAGAVLIAAAAPALADTDTLPSQTPDIQQSPGAQHAPDVDSQVPPTAPDRQMDRSNGIGGGDRDDRGMERSQPGLGQNQMVGQVISVDAERGVVVVKTEAGVIPVHASSEDLQQLEPGDLVMLVMPGEQQNFPSASPAERE